MVVAPSLVDDVIFRASAFRHAANRRSIPMLPSSIGFSRPIKSVSEMIIPPAWEPLKAAHSESLPSIFPTYSRKVFIGGLPADVSRESVEVLFSQFGKCLVDWPRAASHPKERRTPRTSLSGYVFLVYENEHSVRNLVQACTRDHEQLFLLISSPTSRNKPAQVRPWLLSSIDYVAPTMQKRDGRIPIDPRKTVFVGGVPRPTTAAELAKVLEEEFGPVDYVGIDIDPDIKYPKGAARVAFTYLSGYLKAIKGKFVRIPHVDSNKKEVELKPYVLDGQQCDECDGRACDGKSAPYFCGDVSCLQYYCIPCWDKIHYQDKKSRRTGHSPLVRLNDQTKAMKIVPHLVVPTSPTTAMVSSPLNSFATFTLSSLYPVC